MIRATVTPRRGEQKLYTHYQRSLAYSVPRSLWAYRPLNSRLPGVVSFRRGTLATYLARQRL